MTDLVWTDALSAPRSLATRGDTAIAVIEDPGVVEIRPQAGMPGLERLYAHVLGVDLPAEPWSVAATDTFRVVWTGPRRWRLIGERSAVAELLENMRRQSPETALFDLTGGFVSFRIIGATAQDILMRLCPLDLRAIAPDEARGTSIAGVQTLLIRESTPNSWLVLAPRSFADHAAEALVEAARTPGRLGLFEPAEPPPV